MQQPSRVASKLGNAARSATTSAQNCCLLLQPVAAASPSPKTQPTPTHLLLCPVSMFLMLLTRWKMLLLPPPPPPPEPPSAGGAPTPIRLPLLAVRLCTASCSTRKQGSTDIHVLSSCNSSEAAGQLLAPKLHSAHPQCIHTLLASMLLVLGFREWRPPAVPATHSSSGCRIRHTANGCSNACLLLPSCVSWSYTIPLAPDQICSDPNHRPCNFSLTCSIAATHHCGEPSVQPLAHTAD